MGAYCSSQGCCQGLVTKYAGRSADDEKDLGTKDNDVPNPRSLNIVTSQPSVNNLNDNISRKEHEEALNAKVEQSNLLRYKIELLVNMLTIEESKVDSLTKRVEALKWAMINNGLTFNEHTEIPGKRVIQDEKHSPVPNSLNGDSNWLPMYDLKGAIARMQDDFADSNYDIIRCFADEDGKVVAWLAREDFCRQLYAVTSKVSKIDIQVISLRFFDGDGVSVPEFIDFFMSPRAVREARIASSAVRMSLNLLQMEHRLNSSNSVQPITSSIENYNQRLKVRYPVSLGFLIF
jgi:hypothetical protein